ncbi:MULTISPECIES: hypothetical protein [unclassified Nonomuraea]|uniref:hypothetical protein n=1 Tax=unclassified Nonomuraea TaxID=2593643 RepID=UPI0033C045E6
MLGHGRGGNRLLASLVFGGQFLAEPFDLLGVRRDVPRAWSRSCSTVRARSCWDWN